MAQLYYKNIVKVFGLFILFFLLPTPSMASAYIDKVQANNMIDNAYITINSMASINNFRDKLVTSLRHSLAVMIFPHAWKGGLFFLSFGRRIGILFVKAPNGQWSYPTYWTMYNANAGLTFGFQSSQAVLVFEQANSLGNTLKKQFVWGTGVTGSIGSLGSGTRSLAVFPPPEGNMTLYTSNSGFFVGAEVGFNIFSEDLDLTQAFYNNSMANTKTVIIEGKFINVKANKLRAWLQKYSN